MNRREALAAAALAALGPGHALAQPREPGTLRLAFNVAETGFDPQAIGDENSAFVASCIFEAPLTYDPLARPVRLVPKVAAAMPEVSADFRTFTVRIRPGLFFADDPAFGGRPRELVAQDFVYTVKRFYDPRLNSENLYLFENAKLLGLSELRREAVETKRPFDIDREVEGIRALDRYTFRVRTATPNPRFTDLLAVDRVFGAMAREVVEAAGSRIRERPVGTGPYRLAQWRRASLMVLERNPRFRAEACDGACVPVSDRIEVHVIEEDQPRWLAFLGGAIDVLELPAAFAPMALSGDGLAPHLARRGVRLQRALRPEMVMTYFNMRDPVVGGYEPQQVALRRAIALAHDGAEELRLLRNGLGVLAQSTIPPHTSGYDPAYRSEMSEHSPSRAKALLDLHGFVDRDGDGWRERPDGSPLLLRRASLPRQDERTRNELWRKHLAAVGLRMAFDVGTWGTLLEKSRANALMMWGFGWSAATPDGGFFLSIAYGPNAGENNDAQFAWPPFDRLFERQLELPDGPGRDALLREGKDRLVAQMPYKVHRHNIGVELLQPGVTGWLRHPFARDSWRYAGLRMEGGPRGRGN